MVFNFNSGWYFSKVGAVKYAVTLPHDAMQTEIRDRNCLNGKNSGYYPGGEYIYEKYFEIKKCDLDKYIAIHFEGIYRKSKVYINGNKLAEKAYGYSEFTIDISEVVSAGKNYICVYVDNSLEPNSRWYTGSGIYRPVSLIIKEKDYIKNLQIVTLTANPPVIEVSIDSGLACVEIFDGNSIISSGTTGIISLPDAELWSAENPKLYTCRVKTNKDSVIKTFGIRKLEWSATCGLQINGVETLLRGGCIHHDNGILGACAFPAAEERRIRIMKEAGYNAVRSAHNPCSRALLEACDRLGMYVIDEAFDGWYIPKTQHDYSRDFYANFSDDITAMVERDFNHPSVIMYSLGNEVQEISEKRGVELAEEMIEIIHVLDSTRPVTCGINPMLNWLSAHGLGIYKQKGVYIPEQSHSTVKNKKKQKSGSALFNALMQKMNRMTELIAGSNAAGRVIKNIADKLDVVGLNYGAKRYDIDARSCPERIMVGSETLISDLYYNWERVLKFPQIIGDFAWTAWDYLGEAGLGDWAYFSSEGLPLSAGCGAIDLIGTKSAQNIYQQIVWGERDEPYLGVRPLTHSGETPHRGRWRFTDCIDSWNWSGYEDRTAEVEVFGRGDYACLILNGKPVSRRRKLRQFRAFFKISYIPGVLEAMIFDSKGFLVGKNEIMTGGSETLIQLNPDKKEMVSGSQDLCFVSISLIDEKGMLKPSCDKLIRLKVEGAGRLKAFGSALCRTDEIFTKDIHLTHYGRALAIIEAGNESGEISINADAEGVSSGQISISVK